MVSAASPDYDRLSHLLAGAELAPSPAEAQGILCGLLALHLPDALERWHAQLLADPIADSDSGPSDGSTLHLGGGLASDAHAPQAPVDLTFQGRESPVEHAGAHPCCDDHAHHHVIGHDQDHHHSEIPTDGQHHADQETDAAERRAALEQLAAWTQAALDPTSMGFDLLLPPDDWPLHERASAVLDWVRGLLFGLTLGGLSHEQLLGQAGEAFDDLIELTRMDLDAISEDEADEEALTEIVEFLRVAAMLIREDRAKALIDERDRQAKEIGLH